MESYVNELLTLKFPHLFMPWKSLKDDMSHVVSNESGLVISKFINEMNHDFDYTCVSDCCDFEISKDL